VTASKLIPAISNRSQRSRYLQNLLVEKPVIRQHIQEGQCLVIPVGEQPAEVIHVEMAVRADTKYLIDIWLPVII